MKTTRNLYDKNFSQFIALHADIEVLDVGDGDAMILTLKKGTKRLLVVIDGGKKGRSDKVIERIEEKCEELKIDGPDLLVCSHYDSDHIGGVIKIIEKFRKKIKLIWVHMPAPVISKNFRSMSAFLEKDVSTEILNESFEIYRIIQLTKSDPEEKFSFLFESVRQLQNLGTLVRSIGIPVREPFAGECAYDGWPEIKILGPKRTFFNELFSKSSVYELVAEEYEANLNESRKINKPLNENPCSLLLNDRGTSATNKASVIIRVDSGKGTLLFTGDAGVESFFKAEGYPQSITNVKFLKIPHHGSAYNITKDLIDKMNPEVAFNSGDEYEDGAVISCFRSKKERDVRTTKEDGDLKISF